MFYDRQTKAGAADFLGMALIDPIEALEDPVEVLLGNTDPVVCNGELRAVGIIPYCQL